MKRITVTMTEKQAAHWWVLSQNHMDVSPDRGTYANAKSLHNQIERKLDKEMPGWRKRAIHRWGYK